jgi:hypothetical protein
LIFWGSRDRLPFRFGDFAPGKRAKLEKQTKQEQKFVGVAIFQNFIELAVEGLALAWQHFRLESSHALTSSSQLMPAGAAA